MPPAEPAAQRLRIALELAEMAEQMLRMKLSRANPDATAEEIEQQVKAWYEQRPGAPNGDCVGTAVRWPRKP